jgi:hypothetical protein
LAYKPGRSADRSLDSRTTKGKANAYHFCIGVGTALLGGVPFLTPSAKILTDELQNSLWSINGSPTATLRRERKARFDPTFIDNAGRPTLLFNPGPMD